MFGSVRTQITSLIVGPFAVNCYLVSDPETADAVIIDPGDEPDRILEAVNRSGCTPRAILLTHGHADHFGAVDPLREALGVPVMIGRDDAPLLVDAAANGSALFGMPMTAAPADRTVQDEELLAFGRLSFRVLATPGHTPGGVSYLDERHGAVFCGDTLFAGSVGRTDLPGGSMERLLESIERKLLTLPDGTVCYPGHGPQTTVAAERSANPFLVGGHLG